MPTPLEVLLDPVSLLILSLYAGLMTWEAVFPGRALPGMKGWILRGLASFAVFFYLSTYLPLIWDKYLITYQIFDLRVLETFWGTLAGLLLIELGIYLWHRAMHRSDRLWKIFHQMHHSAERLDTYGAFYFSPMDMIGFTLLGSLCLTLLIGVTPQAVTNILLLTTFFSMFQHANIKTPVWLGYLIQRPESHTIHHGKGIHAYNYSDLPVFDIIFGTFKNPDSYGPETGFYPGASARIMDMLLFKDVTKPDAELSNMEAVIPEERIDNEQYTF